LFLFNHIVHHIAATPTIIWFLELEMKLLRHEPNK
jgi:hypothetical protein